MQPRELQPVIRPIQHDDQAQWRPLWDGYNAFYGRSWTTQTTNAAGRALYDKMAEHRGFIVYTREL